MTAISDLKAELDVNAQTPETNDDRARFLVDRFAVMQLAIEEMGRQIEELQHSNRGLDSAESRLEQRVGIQS